MTSLCVATIKKKKNPRTLWYGTLQKRSAKAVKTQTHTNTHTRPERTFLPILCKYTTLSDVDTRSGVRAFMVFANSILRFCFIYSPSCIIGVDNDALVRGPTSSRIYRVFRLRFTNLG